MNIDRFANLVAEALDSLPDEFRERLENVQVDIQEWPAAEDLEAVGLSARDRYALFGLYHGVPMTERGAHYVALPDHISIFKGPIEAAAGPEEEAIRNRVRRTVIHEIAHYYGISDERLEELGWS